jgi:hypothetical protein
MTFWIFLRLRRTIGWWCTAFLGVARFMLSKLKAGRHGLLMNLIGTSWLYRRTEIFLP